MAVDDTQDQIDDTADDAVDPSLKPKSSRGWLKLITDQDKAGYSDYQERCTGIEKQYADLSRLASVTRDRQFQIFWANIEVLKPSMYSRPPVPAIVPRFQDRSPIPRTASEMLERSAAVALQREDIDSVMRQVRDDLAILTRGCIWVRYETRSKDNDYTEKVCIDHKNRRDFVHDPAREWKEVDWVAGGAWMTKKEMRKRFRSTSGDAYMNAEFATRKDDKNNSDGKLKARVWELWSKSQNKVVWVSPGVDVLLDEGEPHLTLEGFFPCPRPAFGTVQRNSLIPVPDFVFYKDQIEEVNDITNRISALSDALRVRGFYPAGAGEIGDAIEAALKSTNDRQIMVPVSNWAMLGGSAKDMIVWLPLDMVVQTITQLIQLRKQLIEDIYQISGLSDIMRGETNPNETATAQNIKTQYGSVRIRDRQAELVRIALDTVRIVAEIMAENFKPDTLQEMSLMELPTDADVAKVVKGLEKQAQQIVAELQHAKTDPEVQQMAQQNPDAAKQIMGQAQQQVQALSKQVDDQKALVTIDQVIKFLRDQKIRAFSLDIETDSTIQPDENAEKQSRAEFLTALAQVLAQLSPMVEARPETAPFAAELLKFAIAPFRVGRSMDQAIDEFADNIKTMAAQPKPQPPDPAMLKAQAEIQALQAKSQAEDQSHAQHLEMKTQEHALTMQAKTADIQGKQLDAAAALRASNAKYAAEAAARRDDRSLARIKVGLPDIEPPASLPVSDVDIISEMTKQNQALVGQIGQFMQGVTQALTAPKTITGPDGRTFTSQTAAPGQ